MQKSINWHRFDTADQVATAAARQIIDAAQQAIADHGRFKLVLAGGTTPEKVYCLLADTNADWANWIIYYGDERCLPVGHPDRNNVLAEQAFLNKVSIPSEQIFTIPAESDPVTAAKDYQPIVANALPFDMVILGLGEDGHTASLFPHHVHNEDELTHPVFNSPKPPSERVSMSAKALSDTTHLLFLVTGANKQNIVKAWRAGADLPIASIEPDNAIDVYIDSAADNAE